MSAVQIPDSRFELVRIGTSDERSGKDFSCVSAEISYDFPVSKLPIENLKTNPKITQILQTIQFGTDNFVLAITSSQKGIEKSCAPDIPLLYSTSIVKISNKMPMLLKSAHTYCRIKGYDTKVLRSNIIEVQKRKGYDIGIKKWYPGQE